MLTYVIFETLFVLCKVFQDVSQQEIYCKTAVLNVLVLGQNKINFNTRTKFVKHFDLDCKHGKPSKQTILAVVNKFLKSGWMFLAVLGRKPGDQQLTLMQVDAQYGKVQRGLSVDFREKLILKRSTLHNILRKKLEESPLQETSKTKDQGSLQRARFTFCN